MVELLAEPFLMLKNKCTLNLHVLQCVYVSYYMKHFLYILPVGSEELVLAVDQYRVYWLLPGTRVMYSIDKHSNNFITHDLPETITHIQAYNSKTQLLPGR